MNGAGLGDGKTTRPPMTTHMSSSNKRSQRTGDDWANLFIKAEHRQEPEVAHGQNYVSFSARQ